MPTDATSPPPIDFLAIGHICHDLVPGGRVVGGAAAYTASVAQALGCRAGIVTRTAPDDNWQEALPGIAIVNIGAPATTIFENIYTPAGRVQTVHAVAGKLSAAAVPSLWTRAPMVFLGPIANEVDPAMVQLFSNSMVGIGPQGWMRRWDEQGRVFPVEWESAAQVLPLAAASFLSVEDLADEAMLQKYAGMSRLLVVTEGEKGCSLYVHHDRQLFPAPLVQVADTTGAGDIFAAAFLVRLFQTDGNIREAAEFANRIAAHSVTQQGLPAKIKAIRCLMGASDPAAQT